MRRSAPFVLAAGLQLISACATYPSFATGESSTAQFATDNAECRQLAETLDGSLDQEAERYEGGSDEDVIGGVVGVAVAERIEKRKAYTKCMSRRGYAKSTQGRGR